MTWQVKVDVTCAGEPHVSASFSRSPITLGTGTENDIVLSAPHISRNHAEVVVARGGLLLRDRSRNGCFVDGRRIGTELALGQRGVIGVPPFEIALTYEGEDPAWQTAYRDLANLVPPVPELPPVEAAPERLTPATEGEPALGAMSPASDAREARPTPTAPLPTITEDPPTVPIVHTAQRHERRMAMLEVVDGPESLLGRTFPLPAGRMLVVGRGGDAAVVLADRSVSRRHAEVILRPDVLAIRDLSSANGVWHEGSRVQTARVGDGERVVFGRVALTLQLPAEESGHATRSLVTTMTPLPPHDDRLQITLAGDATREQHPQLTRALAAALAPEIRGLVLDLTDVQSIGELALGSLAETAERLAERGGALVLVGTGRSVDRALAVSPVGERLRAHMAIDSDHAARHLDRLL